MTITIYGIKTCDTCRKALKALPGAILRDIRADPLSEEERAELLEQFGDAVINRASATWRGLTDVAREAPPDRLLAEHPALMKRPVIRSADKLYLGWKADVKSALGVE